MQCAFNHAFPLLKNRKISLKQKVDGFMLLNIYFLPILVMLSWILSLVLFVFKPPTWFPYEIVFVFSIFFTLNGTVAPLLEIISASICDRRKKLILLTPVLILAYIVNVFICSKAFLDLFIAKITNKNPNRWHKTVHSGE